MTRPDTPFFQRLNEAFANVGGTLDRSVMVQRSFIDKSPAVLARKILSSNSQAVMVYGEEGAAVIDAISTVTARGVPVVTLVSDIPTSPRLAYVGIDHYSAGRTAAFFMEAMVRAPGALVVLCNNLSYRAHAQRVSGFRDRINSRGSDLAVVAVLEGRDDSLLSGQLLSDALRRLQNVAGIYNTGAANRAVEAGTEIHRSGGQHHLHWSRAHSPHPKNAFGRNHDDNDRPKPGTAGAPCGQRSSSTLRLRRRDHRIRRSAVCYLQPGEPEVVHCWLGGGLVKHFVLRTLLSR